MCGSWMEIPSVGVVMNAIQDTLLDIQFVCQVSNWPVNHAASVPNPKISPDRMCKESRNNEMVFSDNVLHVGDWIDKNVFFVCGETETETEIDRRAEEGGS